MNLKELGIYKNTAIQKLLTNTDIVSIVTPNQEFDVERLLSENIFPYEYIPETTDTERTYICIETVVPRFKTNSCTDIQIVLYIFTHKKLMKCEDVVDEVGTRIDILCHKIDELFNGSDDFGIGGLQQMSVLPYKSITSNYYVKAFIYFVPEFNRNRKLQK